MKYFWLEDDQAILEVASDDIQEAAAIAVSYCKGIAHGTGNEVFPFVQCLSSDEGRARDRKITIYLP